MTKRTQIAFVVAMAAMAGSALADTPKAAPMQKPAVPQEVTDMLKGAAGTWRCTGKNFLPDGTSVDMKATMTMKADLDSYWVHESFVAPMGKAGNYKFEAYMTFDSAAKKWRRVQVDNMGGEMSGEAPMTAMKMDMDMEGVGAMGNGKFRDHYDGSDMKAGAHSWGEASMDGGKTYVKVYDMVCKK
jgi:hypothetical protein